MYIANFVFFVATSLIGMLISSVLGLTGIQMGHTDRAHCRDYSSRVFSGSWHRHRYWTWGRPERLAYVFMYGRIQSPILWDISVVTTYMTLSLLLLYIITMIPDMAISRGRIDHFPPWLQKTYGLLSFNFQHTKEQYKILLKAVRILLILIGSDCLCHSYRHLLVVCRNDAHRLGQFHIWPLLYCRGLSLPVQLP